MGGRAEDDDPEGALMTRAVVTAGQPVTAQSTAAPLPMFCPLGASILVWRPVMGSQTTRGMGAP